MRAYERFLNYVSFDTQADPYSNTFPSTSKQKILGEYLKKEMTAIGLSEVEMDDLGFVYGTIEATVENAPVLGFLAHMDTAPDLSGSEINARLVKSYDGKDIVLHKNLDIVLSPDNFESLNNYIGQDLIVTDGTTLLGADDKAGIAEILTFAEKIIGDKDSKHGKIRIAFTVDEEVGSGIEKFNIKKFGADYAYTVDGGEIGELEYENFNAAGANIKINGTNIHPGSAKGQMVSAIKIAMELENMLPEFDKAEYTEGYEGFFHLGNMKGSPEYANMEYIIRDHDIDKFNDKKDRMSKIVDYLNEKYGQSTVEMSLTDSYYNMKKMIEPHMHLIENAKEAMVELGIKPLIIPIRGGTDGARLSFDGLPCPNLCTGGHNFHGRYEYISVQSMDKVVDLLCIIASKYSEA